jgi:DNA-binding response OmpR family regulator
MALILVIDDDQPLRALVREVLERMGHAVEEAEHGEIGIRLFRANPADLVITDLIMPEKEGIETIQQLREEFPEVRILAISGGSKQMAAAGPLEDARMLGADDTLEKPFGIQDLRATVSRILGDAGESTS